MHKKYFYLFLIGIFLSFFCLLTGQVQAGGEIPSKLFDIALVVDKTKISDVSELKARVTFINFGSQNIPAQMTFVITDVNGKEYYQSVDNTVVQTEGVFNKTFKDLTLSKGKYTLILTTLYNTNIKDEFKQDFEIGEVVKSNPPFVAIGVIVLSVISIILIIFILKRNKNKRRKK